MKASWSAAVSLAVVIVLVVGAGLWTGVPTAQEAATLTAKAVAAAPAMDGTIDATWNQASPLLVPLTGGKNLPGGKTEASLRAVHSGDMIYFLLQYKDATQSQRRSPWKKQDDGSWVKMKDPADKGGDNNVVYEDKFAIIWNMSFPKFEEKGCQAACHTGREEKADKPYGNKYTDNPGERMDMWHWKGVRTGPVGQVDDQYVDDTKYDKAKAPEAGRKSDPKTGGGYADNVSDDKKGPKFALPGNKPAPPYWIVDKEKEPFDDAKYKAGDEVPGIVIAPFTGDRGDLTANAVWKDGVWSIAIARKLVTGSEFDVQFSDKKKAYTFGLSVFDNAQVRHAYNRGVLKLTFAE